MRPAPPVAVACNRGWGWPAAQGLLAAAAAAAFAGWLALRLDARTFMTVGAALAAAGLGGASMVFVQRPRPALLQWDGAAWSADGVAGGVEVMLDLGPWVLLRLRSGRAGARWLWVRERDAGTAWHAVRAALYSPAALVSPRPPERPLA